jgi:hypothetical protein
VKLLFEASKQTPKKQMAPDSDVKEKIPAAKHH